MTIERERSQKGIVSQAIDALEERDRQVLSLYFRDRLNAKEIGRVLRMDELDAAELVTSALEKLKLNPEVKKALDATAA